MRVLLINQYYPPDTAPTGQLLADVAEHLARDGHEVHVLCSRRSYAGVTVDCASPRAPGRIRIHRVGATGFGRGSAVRRICDYASFYALAAFRALRLPRMDVCVALTTPPLIGCLGLLLRTLRGTRLVHWTMDLYPEILVTCAHLRPNSLPHRLLARLSRRLNTTASRVVSLGDCMTRRLVATGVEPSRIVTVDNWVPGEVVHPIPRDQSALRDTYRLDGQTTLMYSGNLGVGHDLETVLRALATLPAPQRPRLLIAGQGARRQQLLRMARDLNLTQVTFHPLQPLQRLADSLAAGDIHVVTQRTGTEGLLVPSKLYGLLAAARPVLFIGPTNCQVASILRRSGAGIIVPPGNINLARSALLLLLDRELRDELGLRGHAFYRRHFGRDRSTARIAEAVEHAAGRTGPVAIVQAPRGRRTSCATQRVAALAPPRTPARARAPSVSEDR